MQITNNDSTMFVMCECAVRPEDIKFDILHEDVVECANGQRVKTVTLDTVLQSFEVQNWNGRIYGADLVMDAIDNDGMIQNDIKHGQWIGEYGHPLDLSPHRQATFNPETASHRILSYRRESNLLKAHVQTLADGLGTMMTDRILQGVPAAFSLRSLGSVDMMTHRVKAPLKVLTYDSVYRPSHIEAYQTSVMSECANFIPEGSDLQSLITESTVYSPISESIEQVSNYIKERSANVQKVAEMFHLDRLDMTLTESCRVSIRIDDETCVNIPVESAINMQYADVLKNMKLKGFD